MMDVFNLQASIGLNTKNYIDGIKNCMSLGSKLKSSLEQSAQSVTKQQMAIDTLGNKLEGAKSATSDARNAVSRLTDEFNKSVKATGAASDESRELAVSLDKAEKELADCEKQERELTEQADELRKGTKKAGDQAEESASKFSKFDDGLKAVASTAGKVVSAVAKISAAAVGVAATGLAALTKQAIDASGTYEQLSGGAQKIFDTMDYSVIANDAANAYKDLNMSVNEYLEAINLAGATFAQTMGDQKGYETARTGMLAIADYASGTGKSIDELNQKYQLITRAASSYQSIADQFSGILPATSADFLQQAQAAGYLETSYKKLTDVPVAKYQEAVTKMLEKGVEALGLSQNTARESSETITGSLSMVRAAWENLTTAFGSTDMPIDTFATNFVDSISAAASNVVPRIGQIVQSIGMVFPDLVGNLFENLKSTIEENDLGNTLLDGVDTLVTNAAQVLESMISSIFDGDNLTNLIERAAGTVGMIGESIWNILKLGMEVIPEKLPEIIDILSGMITGAVDTITEDLPAITESITSTIEKLIGGISEFLRSDSGANLIPAVIQSVIDIALAIADNYQPILSAVMDAIPKIVDAIVSNLDEIIDAGTQIIEKFIEGITSDDGSLLDTAVQVVMKLVDAVTENIDDILIAAETLIMALLEGLTKPETLEKILSAGTTVFIKIVEGLASATGSLLGFTDQFTNDVATWLLEYDWAGLGLAIVNGIANGILQIEGVQEAVDGFAEVWADGYIAIEEFVANVKAKWDEFWTNMEELWFKVHDGIESFKTKWADFWANVVETLQTKVEEFKGKIEAIPMKFAELVDNARSWGTDMIQNFIDGITEKWEALKSKVSGVAQMVRDFIGFSEPKEGPLSNFHTYAPDMIDLFTQGIEQNAYKIGNAFDKSLDFGSIDGDIQTAQAATQQDVSGNRTQNAPAYGWDELMQKLDVIVSAIREGKIIKVDSIDNALGSLQDLTERVDFA